jgi:hypothetical protein
MMFLTPVRAVANKAATIPARRKIVGRTKMMIVIAMRPDMIGAGVESGV